MKERDKTITKMTLLFFKYTHYTDAALIKAGTKITRVCKVISDHTCSWNIILSKHV